MTLLMPIYGTRPEAIKMAPVIPALLAASFDVAVTVTGQHREMLDQVNEFFGIRPAHDLFVLRRGQSLVELTARILAGIDRVLSTQRPDAVLVHGDTTTSTAAAMAAFYREIPVIHVEAGLRSGDLAAPFPEEGNRRLTAQLAALHLAPTASSRSNLLAEGIDPSHIVVTGNTVIDALLTAASYEPRLRDPALERLCRSGRRIILVTSHRRENQGDAMRGIGRAFARIAARHPDCTVVLAAHHNPVVREALLPPLRHIHNVLIVDSLPYGEFVRVMSAATIIVTDSGGIQEEAPSLGKPVLVMRDTTERPEAVDAGTVRLIGTGEDRVVEEVHTLLTDPAVYAGMANAVNPYGDGRAAVRVAAATAAYFGTGRRMPDFDPAVPANAM